MKKEELLKLADKLGIKKENVEYGLKSDKEQTEKRLLVRLIEN